MNNSIENQLSSIVKEHEEAISKSKHDDASDILNLTNVLDLITRSKSAIIRASGNNSEYYKAAIEPLRKYDSEWDRLRKVIGAVKALLADIQNDYLTNFEELIHGEVFANYLGMASHLLENNYKDAAAVLIGTTLEVHIRNLADKHGISITKNGKPLKADYLNAELAKLNVYNILDQKNVTAWLDLRNKAAHGKYDEYDMSQVQLYLASVQDFLTRNPA
ncbi:MAG: hypothetical protein F4Z71_04100 [Gammaproteobacteria bacterium]|nr:hypothetical protein [Gammaproteobacteria bacterium]MYE28892.1 hypothetical protein [Gammaproteobacteria bacterium]